MGVGCAVFISASAVPPRGRDEREPSVRDADEDVCGTAPVSSTRWSGLGSFPSEQPHCAHHAASGLSRVETNPPHGPTEPLPWTRPAPGPTDVVGLSEALVPPACGTERSAAAGFGRRPPPLADRCEDVTFLEAFRVTAAVGCWASPPPPLPPGAAPQFLDHTSANTPADRSTQLDVRPFCPARQRKHRECGSAVGRAVPAAISPL